MIIVVNIYHLQDYSCRCLNGIFSYLSVNALAYRQTAQNKRGNIVEKATKETNRKKEQKSLKKGLTKRDESGIIYKLSRRAVARSLKIEQQTKKYKLGYRRKKVTVK